MPCDSEHTNYLTLDQIGNNRIRMFKYESKEEKYTI